MRPEELELNILRLAEQRGLLRPLGEGMLDPSGELGFTLTVWGPRVQALIEAGRLGREAAEALVAEVLQNLDTQPATTVSTWVWINQAELPAGAVQAAAVPEGLPAGTWGHYRDLVLVGGGGAGRVFKAYDTRLERAVALKFLRWGLPWMQDHLLREARAQARVKHPHVCEVFEVGELEDQAYIAMQWIEGGSLKGVQAELSLEAKIRLVIQVCEAVHAAHAVGLLHLDLKPDNILVERLPDGTWHPYVSDFGLVWDTGDASLRPLGVGTPPYASPEQVQGHPSRLGAWSDVHALGVTIYRLLVGRLPHEDLEVACAVPEDLLRVARKAMSPIPAQRYPNPRMLAEDLRRYLANRPLSVHRGSLRYRLQLWARRQPVAAYVLVSSLVLVLSAVGWGIRARWQAKREAQAAQAFGQELKEVESYLKLTHLSPLHDRRAQVKEIRKRMEAVRATLGRVDAKVAAPGYFALGQAHLLLEEPDLAQREIQAAWEGGYQTPRVAEVLGHLLGRSYLEQLLEEDIIPGLDPLGPRELELARRLRDPALSMLKMAQSSAKPGPHALDALVAQLEGQFSLAWNLSLQAMAAQEREPWEYEAWVILKGVWERHEQLLLARGEFAEAKKVLDHLGRSTAALMDLARSDPWPYLVEGDRLLAVAWMMELQGDSPESTFWKAREAFGKSLQADPGYVLAKIRYTDVLRRICILRARRGEEAGPLLRTAIQEAQGVARALPGKQWSLLPLARLHMQRGLVALRGGGEDKRDLETARGLFREMRRTHPDDPLPSLYLAILDMEEGGILADRGSNARAVLVAAREAFRAMHEQKPQDTESMALLARTDRKLAPFEAGPAGRRRLEEAREGLLALLKRHPRQFDLLLELGALEIAWAERSEDPSPLPFLQEAERIFGRLFRLNPYQVEGRIHLAEGELLGAEWSLRQGKNPRRYLGDAVEHLAYAADVNPGALDVQQAKVRLALVEAQAAGAEGRSPRSALARAREALSRAERANPRAQRNGVLRSAIEQAERS